MLPLAIFSKRQKVWGGIMILAAISTRGKTPSVFNHNNLNYEVYVDMLDRLYCHLLLSNISEEQFFRKKMRLPTAQSIRVTFSRTRKLRIWTGPSFSSYELY